MVVISELNPHAILVQPISKPHTHKKYTKSLPLTSVMYHVTTHKEQLLSNMLFDRINRLAILKIHTLDLSYLILSYLIDLADCFLIHELTI